jgi:fatty-acyl-CoA synthase
MHFRGGGSVTKLVITSDQTIAQAVARVVAAYPGREAVVHGRTRLTYAQLQAQVHALAVSLAGLGLCKGQAVGIMLPATPEWIVSFLAITHLGCVAVPLNLNSRLPDLEYVLGHSEAVAVIAVPESPGEADIAAQYVAMRQRLPALRHVIVVGDPVAGGALSYAQLLAAGALPGQPVPQPSAPLSPDDLAALVYTSGTTGFPKGTMHTHRTIIEPVLVAMRLRDGWSPKPNLRSLALIFRLVLRYGRRLLAVAGKQLVFIVAVPFHGISGIGVIEQSLFTGEKMVLVEHIDPRECLDLIQRERGAAFTPIPTTVAMMLRLKDFDRYDLSSLMIVGLGAMPVPPSLVQAVIEKVGCAVTVSFGTTELGGPAAVTSIADPPDVQAHTVGTPLPGVDIKIVDEDRRPLPPTEVGELAVRVSSMMRGYYKDPQASAAAIDAEGFYYTGDLAQVDERGYLRIVGRKKDMIIRGGQNIYAAEIENHLLAHPQIAATAVVGVPSLVGGESVWAFVVPKDGLQPVTSEIADFCRARLPAYKVPERIRLVESLPVTANGKVQKYKLRETALAELDKRK